MRRRITKRTVESMKRGTMAWDTALPGFGVRVRDSGRPYYVVKYGVGVRGRSRWLTLGEHGGPWERGGLPCTLTTELAREEALRLLGARIAGEDPAAVRDARKLVPTVAKAAERFMAEHVSSKLKPSTVAEYERLISKVLVPRLGRLRVDAVTTADVAALHYALRTTKTEANRSLAVFSKLLSWAEGAGIRPKGSVNPCRGIKRYPEKKHRRFLAHAELVRLGTTLDMAEGEQPMAVAAVRLLIFTGARVSEILSLKWENVDVEAGLLRLTDSKTGPKTVYLNAGAKVVLASLFKLSGNPYVLVGRKTGQHFVGLGHVWRRIRSAALIQNVRLHDLRHTFASLAVSAGASLPLIGGLLGHADPKTTQRYAHLEADPLRDVAERVGERITSAMAPKLAKAK